LAEEIACGLLGFKISLGTAFLLAITLVFYLPYAFGQPATYLDYKGSSLGLDIKYPMDWVYNEYTNYFSNDDLISVFQPSSTISFNESSPSMGFASVTIGKQKDLPYKNMPLDLYLEYLKKLRANEGDNITKVEKTKLSDGTPAYEMDITSANNTGKSNITSANNSGKSIIVLMNKSPESYYFVYSASPDKFNTYLPAAQQMIRTLKITD